MSATSQKTAGKASIQGAQTLRRVSETAALDGVLSEWRAGGETVALVPTMGALHEGHLQLVDRAKLEADRVIVSIFVNPTQFGPNEDFARYPRTVEEDCALLSTRDCDAVWLPTKEAIYPEGHATCVCPGPLAEVMDGKSRPKHFDGVATVVSILLQMVKPDVAIFGEKDFQQLAIIKRVHADLRLPGRILGAPTVREGDGLAFSSRNRYLDADERARAPMLHAALEIAANAMQRGQSAEEAITLAVRPLAEAGWKIDYFEARDENLAPLEKHTRGGRLFIAAKLGATRLIDNREMD